MGWNTLYFGVDNPCCERRIAVHTAIAVLALTFYGMWVDFLPSPLVQWTSFHVALLLSIAVVGWVAWANLSGRNRNYRGGAAKMILLAPFAVLVLLFFFWCALSRGVAGGVTQLTGQDFTLPPTRMHTEHVWRRHECGYQLKGGPLADMFFDHICTRSAYYQAYPHHSVEVELVGRRGSLGFVVTGFSHRRDEGNDRR